MPLIAVCLFACIQEPAQPSAELPPLAVGQTVSGEVLDGAPEVHTPTLDSESYADGPAVAASYALAIEKNGTYRIELRSQAFDSYLVLRDAAGQPLAEDDDGLLREHARIVAELEAGHAYRIDACALHGERGPYQLTVHSGAPPEQTRAERLAALDTDDEDFLAWTEAEFGRDSDQLHNTFINFGKARCDEQRYEVAEQLLLRALALQKEVVGEPSARVARVHMALGDALQALNRLREAEDHLRRALAGFETALGPDSHEVGLVLDNLANLMGSLGRLEELESMLLRALAIHESNHGPESVYVGVISNSLAIYYKDVNRFDEAEAAYKRTLAAFEAEFGPEHQHIAILLANLATLYTDLSRFEEAEAFMKRSLTIEEQHFGADDPGLAASLHDLGSIYLNQGRNSEALALHLRALKLREQALGPEHPRLAPSLSWVGLTYKAQNRLAEAEPYYRRSLAIYERTAGELHPDTAMAANNLGIYCSEAGRLDEAAGFYEQALAIREALFDPDHYEVLITQTSLAAHYRDCERYDESAALFRRVIAARERVYGADHPRVAFTMAGLAQTLLDAGQYEESEALMRRALTIRQKTLGQAHPEVVAILKAVAHVAYETDRHSMAADFHAQAIRSGLAYLDRELPTLSESARLSVLDATPRPQSYLASLQRSGEADAAALELCQAWKGKVTRLQAASLALSQRADDPALRALIQRMRNLQRQLASLVLLPQSEQGEGHAANIASLRSERIEVEGEINSSLRLDEMLAAPSVTELQAALPADGVLIDFYVDANVFAWVLPKEGPPMLINTGLGKELRPLQERFLRRHVARGGAAAVSEHEPGAELCERLWGPLREAVGDAATVLVSPDGFLCELPFGILPDDEGFLLEKHRFVLLSDATRLLAGDAAAADREGPMLAVGDVNYYRADAVDGAEQALAMAVDTRSRLGDTWRPLSATRDELESIRGLHEYALEWEAPFDQLDGKQASEEAVRRSITGHRYVHIATHGYFEPDELPSLRGEDPEMLAEQRRAAKLLPGLLSGLVLAGVNAEPEPGRDDGYLSAEEIQYLDLSACDLAVLSACETALGSARAGEGLMSLRRAFEVAGAKTVVSSLWKVDDRATATLMKHFYENYWLKGMGKAEALHQAKLRMLKQNRADFGGDARPETWGAFVLSGDWR